MTKAKDIYTLIEDIQNVLSGEHEFDPENLEQFGRDVARAMTESLGKKSDHGEQLRMSNLGTKCLRQLWYKINAPELGEPLPPDARLKYTYGHLLEELIIFLAKEAGHRVEGRQDELGINGVKGHRDVIIDGVLFDVKSSSTFGMKKFEDNGLLQDDPFGYLDQIMAYLYASKDDPLLEDKQHAAFLAIDKTLGHMKVDLYKYNGVDYDEKIETVRMALDSSTPPDREYSDIPDGKSGNRILGLECSYCPFKFTCWPGLEVYQYSSKPKFMTVVAREPKVQKAEGPF